MTAQNVITQPARATKGASGDHPGAKHKIGVPVNETLYGTGRTRGYASGSGASHGGHGSHEGAVQSENRPGSSNKKTNKNKPFSANPSRSREKVVVSWLQNELTARQSFTYHLRFTMLSPKDNEKIGYTKAQTLNSENGMIVAETGITSKFNITDLETTHIVNWTPKARAAYGLSATMTITEPLGVTLLDNIVRGAKELGIKNHINAAYLLEISFKQSDDDSGTMKDKEGEDRLPYHFVYVMSITDFTMTVDHGGAKYYLKLIEIPQVALFSSVQNSKEATTIKASTLGQFTTEFTKILNERSKKETGTNSKFPDVYMIEFADERSEKMSQWIFSSILPEAPKYTLDLSGDGILNSTFPIGHSVVDILSVAITSTKEMQELPTASGSTAKTSGEDDEKKDSDLRLWFRITPDVQISNTWDGTRNVYRKTFIYKIGLIINENVGDMSPEFVGNKEEQKIRLSEFIERKLLTKKYLYMYTGQNTEVLHFDIKFNHTYWVVKPRYDGMYSNPDTILSQTPSAEEIKNWSNNPPQGMKMGSSAQEVAKSSSSAKPATGMVAGPMDYLQPPESGKFLSQPTAKDSPNQNRYLEALSIDEEDEQDNNWFASIKKPAVVEKINGFVSVAGPSAYKFGAVYQDINGAADLANIELNIIGDPYWLGMSNINKQYANVGGVAASYDQGTNLFYFKLLMPQEHDETGDTVISDSFTISGIYGVREVISSYRDGGFTQHLYAYRSESSNYNLLKDTLDQTVEKKDKPAQSI